jgi:hypothetical protein
MIVVDFCLSAFEVAIVGELSESLYLLEDIPPNQPIPY